MNIRAENRVSALETWLYAFMVIIVCVGMYFAVTDEDFFQQSYVVEDGFLEYLTAVFLFASAVTCLLRLCKHGTSKGGTFVAMTALIFLLMFFGAGEEISWGQRIIGIETGEFFAENNKQNETNLHNLMYNGVNLNKLIFGKVLALFLIVYYLILPFLYLKNARIQGLANRFFIPIPKVHTGLFLALIGIVIALIPSSKNAELNEVCVSIIFFLTILLPQNLHIFDQSK